MRNNGDNYINDGAVDAKNNRRCLMKMPMLKTPMTTRMPMPKW